MSKILTLFEYQQQFSTEEDCFKYLVTLRWPNGMELHRKVGINGYKTAWLLMQKIRSAMASSGKFLLTRKLVKNLICSPKFIQRYLDEFVFRFNRLWNLENIFDKLLVRCVDTKTISYAELTG